MTFATSLLRLMSVALCALAIGCSSDATTSGGDGGTNATPGTGSAASCAKKEAKLSGSLDGASVNETYSSNGYALVLKSFSGTIGSRGNVSITLAEAGASSAGTPIASGTVKMPTEGPSAGETFCVTGGSLSRSEGFYSFTLTGLSRLPAGADAGACPGAAISGELAGCVGGGS